LNKPRENDREKKARESQKNITPETGMNANDKSETGLLYPGVSWGKTDLLNIERGRNEVSFKKVRERIPGEEFGPR